MRHTGASGALRWSSTHRHELGRLAFPCVLADALPKPLSVNPPRPVCGCARSLPVARTSAWVGSNLAAGSVARFPRRGGRTTLETPPLVSVCGCPWSKTSSQTFSRTLSGPMPGSAYRTANPLGVCRNCARTTPPPEAMGRFGRNCGQGPAPADSQEAQPSPPPPDHLDQTKLVYQRSFIE